MRFGRGKHSGRGEIAVQGADELQEVFRQLKKSIPGKEGADIMLDAAKVGKKHVQRKAPAGRTGNLKKGVVAKKFKKQRKGDPAAFVAMDRKVAKHSHLIEYGHKQVLGDWFPGVEPKAGPQKKNKKNRFGKPFKVIGHVPANPFFRRGIKSAESEIYKTISNGVDRVVRKYERT